MNGKVINIILKKKLYAEYYITKQFLTDYTRKKNMHLNCISFPTHMAKVAVNKYLKLFQISDILAIKMFLE